MTIKYAEPLFNIKVSPEEKQAAREIRSLFNNFLKTQKSLSNFLSTFFSELEKTADTSNIQKISPALKEYIHAYRDLCNNFIKDLETAVQYMATNFSDADMINHRDLIVESVRDIRDNSIELISTFNKIDDPNFVTNIKDIYQNIQARLDKLEVIINEELFGHIDYNILGKIRLSSPHIPLSIKQGTNTKI